MGNFISGPDLLKYLESYYDDHVESGEEHSCSLVDGLNAIYEHVQRMMSEAPELSGDPQLAYWAPVEANPEDYIDADEFFEPFLTANLGKNGELNLEWAHYVGNGIWIQFEDDMARLAHPDYWVYAPEFSKEE